MARGEAYVYASGDYPGVELVVGQRAERPDGWVLWLQFPRSLVCREILLAPLTDESARMLVKFLDDFSHTVANAVRVHRHARDQYRTLCRTLNHPAIPPLEGDPRDDENGPQDRP